MKIRDYFLLSLLLCLAACGPHARIAVEESTRVSERFAAGGTLWVGSRSAAVLMSPEYARIAPLFEQALTGAGFEVVSEQALAETRAYIWFGKRSERREQFSNVTDNISITTEYTWGLSLEITSWIVTPSEEIYFSAVETAVWCQSISGVVDELAEVVVRDFPRDKGGSASIQVTLGPGGC